MDWIPVVFIIFKVLVFGTGMFFAIKWHYDQGRKGRHAERRAVLRTAAMLAAVFLLMLLGLLAVTFFVGREFGMDLSWP